MPGRKISVEDAEAASPIEQAHQFEIYNDANEVVEVLDQNQGGGWGAKVPR